MQLTEEQILSLAPDESSKKSGKELAAPAKWVTCGATETAVWGECSGSGSKPYQTQADLANIAFKCSCPSRKFPCKHGLGLLLFYTRNRQNFTQTTMPPWVEDWISKRATRQEKQSEKSDKPVDEAAQAKRQQARRQKVAAGIEELGLWVKDIVRNGILAMPEKDHSFFENMARRMVDAQAPGLAGMVRSLGETGFYADGWQTRFMNQLVRIYIALNAFRNIETQSSDMQQEIQSWIGFTQNQDELKTQEGITDNWLVLAKQLSETDNITTEKNWLLGAQTNRYALVLQFLVRGQGAQQMFSPGLWVPAELVFYPSESPLRAIIKTAVPAKPFTAPPVFQNWQQVAEAETDICSRIPVRGERPFLVANIKPVLYNGSWWLQDDRHHLVKIKEEQKMIWKLLSVTGAAPATLAVIGQEHEFEPVGIWQQNTYSAL